MAQISLVDHKIRVAELDDDTNDLINHLFDQLGQKTIRNYLRASYYDGKRAVHDLVHVVPPQYWQLGVVLGWTAKSVDLLMRRCNLDGFVWPDGNLDDIGWSAIWDGNMLGSEVDQGLTASLIHSVAFVITTRGGPGEPPAMMHFKNAMDATGDWDSRARRMANLLSITDRDDDGKPSGFVLYLHGHTITVVHTRQGWEVADWQQHPWGVPVDPLPYQPRSGRPFGSSRITRPMMAVQDRATAAVIRLEGHSDVYSYPDMWMLGADESIFTDESGNILPKWQVMLGRIKGIPDDEDATNPRADVKQFPAASPQPHLATINAYAKMFAREASLPDHSLAITDVANPTSAESYDASQWELIKDAESANANWDPGLRRAGQRALAMANGLREIPPEWASIAPKWRDSRYDSRAAQADAGLKQLQAVPWLADTEVGLELLGLDEQQIVRALAERRRAQGSTMLDRLLSRTPNGGDVNPAP